MKTYKYSTKERAERVSKTLGCAGYHYHNEDGERKYMPCKTHDIFLSKTKNSKKPKESEVNELVDDDGTWLSSNTPILDPASTGIGTKTMDQIIPSARNPRDPLLRGWYGYYGEGHVKEEIVPATDTNTKTNTNTGTTKYVVQPGDTLSEIAADNNISLKQLLALNPKFTNDPKYKNGNMIWSGTTVKLPTGSGAAAGSGGGGGGFMQALAKGGLINPMRFAMGGFARGTDTVPAMLTPGEFIMSKYAVDSYGLDTMKQINKGEAVGGSVYNNTYTLTVNAKTDANPNDIAQAVMATIKQVDDRRIRGVAIGGRR